MPMGNIASVMTHGILSYERASKLAHHSVAMQAIQDRRDQKYVPRDSGFSNTPTSIFMRATP